MRGKSVSALLLRPADARALLVLAHGQIMSIDHPFMEAISAALARTASRRCASTSRTPKRSARSSDPMPLLVESVRGGGAEGEQLRGSLPLLVGGKSAGALVAVQAASEGVCPGRRGS